MLYLNYDRQNGEWAPNEDGGTENKEAIRFFQKLNTDVLSNFPGVMMIAEESTAWPNVTKPPAVDGLGFNFKWNMGWMNDTLEYFRTDMPYRAGVHNKLTFAITYAYSENFILPISHDEVVHEKCSLLSKMPGEYDDKFAGERAFLVYMMTHPGKKLLFMGQEFGQFTEWDEKKELDWMLLDYDQHAGLKEFVKELNHYYKDTEAMWKLDNTIEGFRWIDPDNANDNVYTYYRTSGEGDIALVAINLSGRSFEEYDIGVPDAEDYECVIDTLNDRSRKGTMYKPEEGVCNGYEQHVTIPLPKLSAVILEKR
jgi:1,4-alpha-glucan branching enzyme